MLTCKNFVYVFILITVTACKTSPTNDGATISEAPLAVTANSQSTISDTSVSQTSEVQQSVVSSAGTGSGLDADITTYKVMPGDFNLYPRETNGWDESGWSIITPSEDSRLIYVSFSSGDDETAEFYLPRDLNDVKNPGPIKPFKTIEAANVHARGGFPDWILLRQGDAWEVHDLIHVKTGRSVTERLVVTSYGQSGERPIIKSDAIEAFRIWSNRYYIAITGIAFYAYKRDPNSPDFAGWGKTTDSNGVRFYSPEGTTMGTVLLEDNDFNYFSKGISITGGGDVIDTVIRRNIIRNSYSELAHSQGIYAAYASVLLEENIFDHNGWYKNQIGTGNGKSEGQATMFNHNTYFSESFNTIFRKNIFLRSSSIQNKWAANSDKITGVDTVRSKNLLMEDNLYVGGEIAISAGGNRDHGTGFRWKNVNIVNNVMLAIGRDQPTNRALGWYIDSSDWQGGNICGNYLLHNDNPVVTNLTGIELDGHSSNIKVSDNLIHGLIKTQAGDAFGAITIDSAPKSNISVTNNRLQLAGSQMRVLVSEQISEVEFSDNSYYSSVDSSLWFRSGGVDYDLADWALVAGDGSSVANEQVFLNPQRNFESYLSSIGLNDNIDSFMEAIVSQNKSTWGQELTAKAIIAYIRNGYGGSVCSEKGIELLSNGR